MPLARRVMDLLQALPERRRRRQREMLTVPPELPPELSTDLHTGPVHQPTPAKGSRNLPETTLEAMFAYQDELRRAAIPRQRRRSGDQVG